MSDRPPAEHKSVTKPGPTNSRAALSLDEPDYWARLYGARVSLAEGRADKAVPALRALLHTHPEHAETLHALSLAYAALGDREAARKALLDAVAAIPDGHPWMGSLRAEWQRRLDEGSSEP